MPNQPEVNSRDQHVWRQERNRINARLANIARFRGCNFVNLVGLDFDKLAVNADKTIWSLLFDLIPSVDKLHQVDQSCQEHGTKIWFVTDNIIDRSVYFFKNITIWSFPELLGITAVGNANKAPASNPSRLYNCFIQRCESVRQSWFYYLWIEQLLDKGYVSYLLYQLDSYSTLTGVELFDFIHYNRGLSRLDKFNQAYHALRSQVPYQNFVENFDLTKLINDTKYSVILETYANSDDQGGWCITEKCLRSLQTTTINLVFAQKHTIKKLAALGFDIDDINQEWDGDEWHTRQQKILEVLKKDIICFDISRQQDRCDHNINLLQSWKRHYQQPNFFDAMTDHIQTA